MTVIDVAAADFQREVIERSASVPVVVDFWAEWCAPCRQLGPLLESAASTREGKVVLAKVDTDAAPGLAQDFQIRGIPAVKAFNDGRVVAEFVGLQGPAAVERFFDELRPLRGRCPSRRRGRGRAAPGARARATARGCRPRAGPDRARPGRARKALDLLARAGGFQAEGLAARIRLEQSGVLAAAFAALDQGRTRAGLELLLDSLAAADGDRDDVRRVIVGELDLLGADDPLARDTRRRLAAALY